MKESHERWIQVLAREREVFSRHIVWPSFCIRGLDERLDVVRATAMIFACLDLILNGRGEFAADAFGNLPQHDGGLKYETANKRFVRAVVFRSGLARTLHTSLHTSPDTRGEFGETSSRKKNRDVPMRIG